MEQTRRIAAYFEADCNEDAEVKAMRPAWHKGKALEYQSKTECVSVPKMRTIPRRRLRPLCVLYGSFEGQGVRGCHGETEWRDIQIQW